jgi:hypothetical protein
MVSTRRLGEMIMILCAQKMGSRLTLVIPRMLPNCGYAWTRKKWAREYQFVEDNKGYTSGVEEFGDRREAGERIVAGKIFKSRFIGKYLIFKDHYIALLNSTLKKIIMLRGSMILKVYNFLENLPA